MQIPELLDLLAIGTAAGLVALVAWRRPPAPLWPTLLYVYLASLLWAIGDLGSDLLLDDPTAYWSSVVVLYTGVLALPPTWWLFALQFTEFQERPLRWAGQTVRYGPFGLAAAFWLALVTNPWHGLFIVANPGTGNEFQILWFAQAGLAYLFLLGAAGLFLRLRWSLHRSQVRGQLDIMLVASLLPLACNLFYVTSSGERRFDPTVASFAVSGLLFFLGIYRDRLFALSPVTLQRLIRQETDGILLLDRNRRLMFWNPAARLLLQAGDRIPGDVIFPDLVKLLSPPKGHIDGDDLWTRLTTRAQPPDGHVFRFEHPSCDWLRLESTPIIGPGGSFLGTGLRLRDVTALRRASEVVAEQAGALEAILSSADQGLLVIDASGRMVYSNQAYQDLWGLPDHIIEAGDPNAALAFVKNLLVDPEAFRNRVREVYRNPLARSLDEIHLRDDRIIERTSRPLLRDGEPAGRVWTFRDVTRQRREAAERRRLEIRMQEAQKLESLGILAGGIAHDFNNLLVGIQGNAELALSDLPAESRAHACVADVRDAAERAAELTGQMLAYSGKGRFVLETIDLSRLVEDTAHLLEAVISKKAAVQYYFSAGPSVEGDVTQLRQVVMNLITNASDALCEDEGTVRIATGSVDLDETALSDHHLGEDLSPGHYGFIEVTDSGCGMDEATASRIFEPFFTTKFTGRGLGLAAVLGIVRGHRGAIQVESEPGHGTSFRVLLPCLERPAPLQESVDEPSPDEFQGFGTVLVVDDEPGVLRTTQKMLERWGFRVLTAADGREGTEIFDRHADEIVVVVLDMTMPRMDGAEALRAIRTVRPGTRVILTSGYSEQEALNRFTADDLSGFLQKPFRMQDLAAALKRALED